MASRLITSASVPEKFISLLDVSVHKPDTTLIEIKVLCELGLQNGFNIISNSIFTKFVRQYVGTDSQILVGATVGFPFGTSSSYAKVIEAQRAIQDGADEIDMVLAVGLLRGGEEYYPSVREEIRSVVDAVHDVGGKTTKVIIETCYLTEAEKEIACQLVTEAGAEFVKTSTGYGPSGATLEDIRLMRRLSGKQVKVKAAGGIRTLAQCLDCLDAGADRLGIGLPSALAILAEVHTLHA